MAETKAPPKAVATDPGSESWNRLPWRKLEKHCYRIQKRIFKAESRGNSRAVHKLQKLLMRIQGSQTGSSPPGHSGQPGQEDGGSRRDQTRQSPAAI